MANEIDLAFIARQLDRVLAEQAGAREMLTNARIGYVERSLERVEAAITVLTLEVRTLRNQIGRMNDRIVRLEDAG